MKNKYIWFTVSIVAVLMMVGIWRSFRQSPTQPSLLTQTPTTGSLPPSKPQSSTNVTTQENNAGNGLANPYAELSADELMKKKPPMFKTQIVPPPTPAEKAMWQWREAMQKADPGYAYKTPIEFYGKVVDQNDQPVAGATVDMNWTGIRGEALDKATKTTGADGQFVLTGVQGKLLIVWVHKYDCISKVGAQGDYNFVDFSEPNFYSPDPKNPVVFHVWKLGNPEPMYYWNPYGKLSVDGKLVWLNIQNGRIGSTGDLAFSVVRHDLEKGRESGYTLTVQSAPGVGMAMSVGEEFMFQAPANGYQPVIRIEQAAMRNRSDMDFKVTQTMQFYVRTTDGKYAAVKAEVGQSGYPEASLEAFIYFNPSRSRNLEFDQNKWINR
jgi:hypothetical protein